MTAGVGLGAAGTGWGAGDGAGAGAAFHSWALAEKVADLALEALESDPAQALALADLAHRIANLVAGSEAWKARVRGYALAVLARALRETEEEEEGAREAEGEARRLWAAGAEAAELGLSEDRYRAAMEP